MSDQTPLKWDEDPFASLFALEEPRRKLSDDDEVFIEKTLRMIAENPSYKGVLVMHDEQTDRMRYVILNNSTLLGAMASMGRIFSRLSELASAEASSE